MKILSSINGEKKCVGRFCSGLGYLKQMNRMVVKTMLSWKS